jgi:uncharacterized protein (TIGR03435 family)
VRLFRTVCTTVVVFSSSALLFGQTSAKPKPAFEVVSIKPIGPFQIRPEMNVSGNRFDYAMPLVTLIASAYQIKTYQIVGPDWLNSQRFEIHAIIPEGAPRDQIPAMLQTLLEDRFKLKAHLEKKEQLVYALVVSKEGSKLMKADEISDEGARLIGRGPLKIKQDGDSTIIFDPRNGTVVGGARGGTGVNGTMRMQYLKISMPTFAEGLKQFVDRPVIDATNLTGFYKMTMELPMEVYRNSALNRPMPADVAAGLGTTPFSRSGTAAPAGDTPTGTASDPAGKVIFSAVEKLGLKLERRKAPIETLIIEHIEKNPTEN